MPWIDFRAIERRMMDYLEALAEEERRMASIDWRARSRVALELADVKGRLAGLSGRALERYAREHGYPFGVRAHHPYKIWLSEARRFFAKPGRFDPVEVVKIKEVSEGTEWVGRIRFGGWIRLSYRAGELTAHLSTTSGDWGDLGEVYRATIAEPTQPVCDVREAVELLEKTGVFDFAPALSAGGPVR